MFKSVAWHSFLSVILYIHFEFQFLCFFFFDVHIKKPEEKLWKIKCTRNIVKHYVSKRWSISCETQKVCSFYTAFMYKLFYQTSVVFVCISNQCASFGLQINLQDCCVIYLHRSLTSLFPVLFPSSVQSLMGWVSFLDLEFQMPKNVSIFASCIEHVMCFHASSFSNWNIWWNFNNYKNTQLIE